MYDITYDLSCAHIYNDTTITTTDTTATNINTTLELTRALCDAHCCHMGTAINHPVPDRSFVIFDIRAL